MKRPIPIYFVAFWCFFAMAMQVNGFKLLVGQFFATTEEGRSVVASLGLLNIVSIWNSIRLVQLKRLNILISLWVFGFWTVILCVNSVVLFLRDAQFASLVAQLMFFAALNVMCLMYLGRPSFREFAARFVAEREGPQN